MFVLSNARADTLSALLNDIQNDVVVVQKVANCKANPYLLDSQLNHAIPPCSPVIALCPTGSTAMPKITNCTLNPTASDSTILAYLKKVNSFVTDLGNPIQKTNLNGTGIQCDSQREFQDLGKGYSAFCFYDMAKIRSVGPLKRWAKPSYVDSVSGLVTMSNNLTITLSELNIAANYTCFNTSVKASARCVTLPAGFLDKLGIKTK